MQPPPTRRQVSSRKRPEDKLGPAARSRISRSVCGSSSSVPLRGLLMQPDQRGSSVSLLNYQHGDNPASLGIFQGIIAFPSVPLISLMLRQRNITYSSCTHGKRDRDGDELLLALLTPFKKPPSRFTRSSTGAVRAPPSSSKNVPLATSASKTNKAGCSGSSYELTCCLDAHMSKEHPPAERLQREPRRLSVPD